MPSSPGQTGCGRWCCSASPGDADPAHLGLRFSHLRPVLAAVFFASFPDVISADLHPARRRQDADPAACLGRRAGAQRRHRRCQRPGSALVSRLRLEDAPWKRVVGIFDDRRTRISREVSGYPVLGSLDDLVRYVRSGKVHDVVITLPWSADDRLVTIIGKLRALPVR
ncbi:MAG: hypothetical protein U1E33_02865 [Rhodospirillales bacterium]